MLFVSAAAAAVVVVVVVLKERQTSGDKQYSILRY